MAPATASPASQRTEYNHLALWSFVLSLALPIGAILNATSELVGIATRSQSISITQLVAGDVLTVLGLPAMFAAIITGHMALSRAKRYPPTQRRWALAIAGLVIGYLTVAAALTLIVGFIWLANAIGPSGLVDPLTPL
jgi:hypothetical protein